MKKKSICNYFMIVFSILVVFGCNISSPEDDVDIDGDALTLSIPEGFDFSTYHEVTINIIDQVSYAKYDVYAYTDELYDAGIETFENESGETVTETVYKSEVLDKLIFSGVPSNGVLKQTVNLPKYYSKVYIRRNEHLNFYSSISDIVDQEVNYTFSNPNGHAQSKLFTSVNDYLYSVNEAGQLFQIDPLTGILTDLSTMPMGSYTCAIDQEDKMLYSIGRSSPFPLMKYSIVDDKWETVSNVGFGGPRLEFNATDRLLYFSNEAKLYSLNPKTGARVGTWDIVGLHNTSGGDLAFADNGKLYLCSASGLYGLELDANGKYQSTRISADNLPFTPTSMTFDSNQELWIADISGYANLIIMDTQTGGWQYKYGVKANNNSTYKRAIHDLATFKVYSESIDETDSDGDGVLDKDDAYPNDPDASFELFSPSKYGTGTIAFEDLWPSNGDYDFNDAALSYQAIAVLNSDNLAVRLDFICNIKANGAGYTNGIGFEMEGVSPSQIESVSGTVLTQNFIELNANGTEAGQDNAVIILADDVDNILNETTISIKFVEPIKTSDLGVAPFNPFIIVNKNREKEIHLPYMKVTNLGISGVEINGVNKDSDGNFISQNGFPWAISIIHDFKVPKEKIDVTKAYNYFGVWAESGGTVYVDWYKDNTGYRNVDLLQ